MSKVQIGDKITSRIDDQCVRGTVVRVTDALFVWRMVGVEWTPQDRLDVRHTEGIEWALGWDTVAADALRVAVALGQR